MAPTRLWLLFFVVLGSGVVACRAQCIAATYACSSDCRQLLLCQNVSGVLNPLQVADCTTNGGYCNITSRGCSSNCGNIFKYPCTSVGFFPDPYDCTKYFQCAYIPGTSIFSAATQFSCAAGLAYNPSTGLCGVPLQGGLCPSSLVVRCDYPGQYGIFQQNPTLVYYCKTSSNGVLYPVYVSCSSGIVDPSTGTCVVATCNGTGNFADTVNCTSFYWCASANSTPVHQSCYPGFYYDAAQNLCLEGSCSNTRDLETVVQSPHGIFQVKRQHSNSPFTSSVLGHVLQTDQSLIMYNRSGVRKRSKPLHFIY